MKYICLVFLFFSSIVYSDDRYPDSTVSVGAWTISVNSKDQPTQYTKLPAAIVDATLISQKCSCEVIINQPKISIKSVLRVISTSSSRSSISSSSASSASTFSKISFYRPKTRMDTSILLASDIAGYELHRTPPDSPMASLIIPPQNTDPIVYTLPWQVAVNDKLQIAAFDKNGLYSDYVDVSR